jgi:DNA-binding CsgD family transcriptional regulator
LRFTIASKSKRRTGWSRNLSEISRETGRNQLKSIFAKTGTNRQAELVLAMAKML